MEPHATSRSSRVSQAAASCIESFDPNAFTELFTKVYGALAVSWHIIQLMHPSMWGKKERKRKTHLKPQTLPLSVNEDETCFVALTAVYVDGLQKGLLEANRKCPDATSSCVVTKGIATRSGAFGRLQTGRSLASKNERTRCDEPSKGVRSPKPDAFVPSKDRSGHEFQDMQEIGSD